MKKKLNSGSLNIHLDKNNATISTQAGSGNARTHTFTFAEAFEEDFGSNYKAQVNNKLFISTILVILPKFDRLFLLRALLRSMEAKSLSFPQVMMV